jgi:very-short-patch-repair endonuclease
MIAKVKNERRIRTSAGIQQRAKELRQEMTRAGQLLWDGLRKRQLSGLKFQRQHPLGPFISDFYCAEKSLVVEIDGDIHDLQKEQDEQRTRQFEEFGYQAIRFRNKEVETNTSLVLKKILEACTPSSPGIGRRVGDEGSQGFEQVEIISNITITLDNERSITNDCREG